MDNTVYLILFEQNYVYSATSEADRIFFNAVKLNEMPVF